LGEAVAKDNHEQGSFLHGLSLLVALRIMTQTTTPSPTAVPLATAKIGLVVARSGAKETLKISEKAFGHEVIAFELLARLWI
jgi:hypothetical protein